MRSYLSTPPSAAKGPPAQPVPARRDHARGLHPATQLPSCAKNFLPNLTQSLVNSRLTLLHLYVPFTLQSIGQRGYFYRLPAARIPLRFPRFSCTKTAICAVAVNHPHHTNCVNHSSNKCQPALVHALLPVNPSIRRRRASSAARTRPARDATRAASASLPSAVLRPKFLARSLVNSRKLSSISRTSATPSTAAKRPPARPVRRYRVCPVSPKISCPISHNLS